MNQIGLEFLSALPPGSAALVRLMHNWEISMKTSIQLPIVALLVGGAIALTGCDGVDTPWPPPSDSASSQENSGEDIYTSPADPIATDSNGLNEDTTVPETPTSEIAQTPEDSALFDPEAEVSESPTDNLDLEPSEEPQTGVVALEDSPEAEGEDATAAEENDETAEEGAIVAAGEQSDPESLVDPDTGEAAEPNTGQAIADAGETTEEGAMVAAGEAAEQATEEIEAENQQSEESAEAGPRGGAIAPPRGSAQPSVLYDRPWQAP